MLKTEPDIIEMLDHLKNYYSHVTDKKLEVYSSRNNESFAFQKNRKENCQTISCDNMSDSFRSKSRYFHIKIR